MQVRFKDKKLEDFYEGKLTLRFFANLQRVFQLKVNVLKLAPDLMAIRAVRGLHFEKYSVGKYKDKHSIRINDQWRLIIDIHTIPDTILILEEIVDYH